MNLGTLHTVDPAVLDEDPFWSVVRRRHPDATVVLVPPEAPPEQPPDRQDVRAEDLDEVIRALVEAWQAVAPIATAAGDDGAPSVSWRARPGGHALVVRKALRGIGSEQGTTVLRTLAGVLGRQGWLLRPSSRDEVAVLDARAGRLDLRAEAGPGATVLTLATGVLPVAASDRRRAQRAVGEEVASWR